MLPIALVFALASHATPLHSPRPVHPDTVQAGDTIVAARRLHNFSLVRRLTLTRGDSVTPFGRQTQRLSAARLEDRPVLLDVQVFDPPRGTTVDSSWVDARTLRPIRLRSVNASRIVELAFDGTRVRGRTTPDSGKAKGIERDLGVRAFEWNILALAIAAQPLRPGYRATLPVYVDRFDRVVWYAVEVSGEGRLESRPGEPMWEVLATPDSAGPAARYWIGRRDRVVNQVIVSEPGISIRYARE
jgi:hypothetical protein